MAGSFSISKDIFWGPAGWVYDNALEGIAKNLAYYYNYELCGKVLASTTYNNGGMLVLDSVVDAEVFRSILKALERYRAEVISRKDDFPKNHIDGYINQLDELAQLLQKRLDELSSTS